MSDSLRAFFVGAGIVGIFCVFALIGFDKYLRSLERKLRTT